VLDVKDEVPRPKSAATEFVFNRSILILASERALKFTAPNKERHYLWLTALSFLAQSGRGPPQVPRIPQAKPVEKTVQIQRCPSFPLRYETTRDPVRNAPRHERTVTETIPMFGEALHGQPTFYPQPPPPDEAEPPNIPRVSARGHQRKRSNTNPAMPPRRLSTSLRSFSSNGVGSTMTSALARVHSNSSPQKQTGNASSYPASRRTSVTSPDQPNFFEAMGTVRMEAFVMPNYQDGVLYLPAGPSVPSRRKDRRRGDSILSSTTDDRRRAGYIFDDNGTDPFTGF